MKYRMLFTLLIAVVSHTTSMATADDSAAIKAQHQTSDNVTQATQQGHNFNNIGGDVNITVKGISRKEYRDDLNALEKKLKQEYEKNH